MQGKALTSATVCLIVMGLICSAVAVNSQPDLKTQYNVRASILISGLSNAQQHAILSFPDVMLIDDYGAFVYVSTTLERVDMLRNSGINIQIFPNLGRLQFDSVAFNTASGEPDIPDAYRANTPMNGQEAYYIVQVNGPVKQQWLDSVYSLGAKIIDLVDFNGYIVKATPESIDAIRNLPFISWTGLYHPYYKLWGSPQKLQGQVELSLAVYKESSFWEQFSTLREMGFTVTFMSDGNPWWNTIYVRCDASRLPELASFPNLMSVEPVRYATFADFTEPVANAIPRPAPTNNEARWIIQSGVNGSYPIWDQNLHGEGIIVGIADTGIDYDHTFFTDKAGDQGDPNSTSHRKVVRYDAPFGYWADDVFGHGTHTGGTIAGCNITNPGNYTAFDGEAYNAKLCFFDVGGMFSFNVGNLTNMLMNATYANAYSHSNSWGFTSYHANYTQLSVEADIFCWNHPDFLPIYAAGNEYSANTIRAPGTSKSVVTVAASQNANNNIESLAAFSSRGPAPNGIRKPDVAAPGQDIWSAKSDAALGTYNGDIQPMSGTSMATPTVAGGCALVEQYFREGFYPTGVKDPGAGFIPSQQLRKAMLINSGHNMANGDKPIPDDSQGWGRILLDDCLYFNGDSKKLYIYDTYKDGGGLGTGAKWTKEFNIDDNTVPFEVSVCWADFPGGALKNNLDLVVTDPVGGQYVGSNYASGVSVKGSATADTSNPIECVYVKTPDIGKWTVEVTALNVAYGGKQNFSAVITGSFPVPAAYGIKLNTPKGGETIPGGSSYNIDWTTNGGAAPISVEVFFSDDSGSTWSSVASGQPANGTYSWSVPSTPLTTARIKVEATDSASNKTSAQSGDFTITGPSFTATLIQPNGGEKLQGGKAYEIKWNTTNGTGLTIDIFSSTDSGATWSPISNSEPDDGSYMWTVLATDTTKARIKICAFDGIGEWANDTSDADFTIDSSGPVVTITAPATSAKWAEGDRQVSWTIVEPSGLATDAINISYSLNSGGSWTSLATDRPSTDTTYTWTITADSINCDTVKVKVTAFDIFGFEGSGESGVFTIDSSAPTITHTPITSGSTGTAIPVSVDVTDTIGPLTVELTYTPVGSSTPTSIAMSLSGSHYGASIPAQTSPGTLKYHITASDGTGHWAIEPATDQSPSGDKNHTVTISDSSTTGSISGKVSDTSGNPLSGATITASVGSTVKGSATTDSSGDYTISGLAPDTYKLTVNKTGYIDGSRGGVLVTAGSDSPDNDFSLVKWTGGTKRTITGAVTDAATGNPLVGATVTAVLGSFTDTQTTDPYGSFTFVNLSPGNYTITASMTNYTSKTTYADTTTQNVVGLSIQLEKKQQAIVTDGGFPIIYVISIIAVIIVVVIVLLAIILSRRKKKQEPQQFAYVPAQGAYASQPSHPQQYAPAPQYAPPPPDYQPPAPPQQYPPPPPPP